MILAIDPGTTESGWCLFDGDKVLCSDINTNALVLSFLQTQPRTPGAPHVDTLAIEMMQARGMPMSNDAMKTLVWVGRFQQAWHQPEAVRLITRFDVKMHVCQSGRAKDANVRQALIDKLGPQGTKKAPGPTYGVKSHAWAALGVAVTAAEAA